MADARMSDPDAMGAQAPPHGTLERYQARAVKCRCDACRKARADYMRAYRKRGADKHLNARLGTCVRGLGWPR